jgi:hypothetical protein
MAAKIRRDKPASDPISSCFTLWMLSAKLETRSGPTELATERRERTMASPLTWSCSWRMVQKVELTFEPGVQDSETELPHYADMDRRLPPIPAPYSSPDVQ